jgi:hypothetical protein
MKLAVPVSGSAVEEAEELGLRADVLFHLLMAFKHTFTRLKLSSETRSCDTRVCAHGYQTDNASIPPFHFSSIHPLSAQI